MMIIMIWRMMNDTQVDVDNNVHVDDSKLGVMIIIIPP